MTLEINSVTKKVESQNLSSEAYDPNPEFLFTQTTDPVNKSKSPFQNLWYFCHKSNHSVSNCFRKSPVKSIIQNFKAYKKQVLPVKQVCSYPVNYHSRIGYDSRNHLSARNPYSSYRSSQLRSSSISRSLKKPR